MSQKPIHAAIMSFIQSFQDIRCVSSQLSSLHDGVTLWELMKHIPQLDTFTPTFTPTPSSFSSILTNLKTIIHTLKTFYDSTLKLSWQKADDLDLIQIARNHNQPHIVKLFMAVLGAAIESDSKQFFIQKILTLPEEAQAEFVGVIKGALGKGEESESERSPKLEKNSSEKVLLEKLEELESENQRLTQSVREVEGEREEMGRKVGQLQEMLLAEQRENEKLNQMLRETCSASNEKHKEAEKEKAEAYIQNLKGKLLEITRVHEKELAKLQHELELQRSGFVRVNQLQEQLEHYQEKYEECKQIMVKYEKVETERNKLIKLSDEKEESIKKLKERVAELTDRIYELEERELYDRMELEKKSTRIDQLYKQIENIKSRQQLLPSLPLKSAKSLSQICPQINQGQVLHLKQHNQTLLSDLQKSTKKIRSLQRQLERYKRQYERIHSLEAENKKLEEILLEYNQTRGEENELLVGCLYELRTKYRELLDEGRKEARLSLPMRAHNKMLQKKMLS